MTSNQRDRGTVQSVERALALLAALARSPKDRSLASLYREVGLSRSTAHRLMATLRRAGWVFEDPDTRRNRVSFLPAKLASRALEQFPFRASLLPYLVELSSRSDSMTVRLYALMGVEKAPILEIPGRDAIPSQLHTGRALPVHYGHVGRMLLAHRPPAERDIIIEELWNAPHGIRSRDEERELYADLRRLSGLQALTVVDEPPVLVGLGAVLIPIRGENGYCESLVGIIGMKERWNYETIAPRLPALLEVTDAASEALGYVPVARRMLA